MGARVSGALLLTTSSLSGGARIGSCALLSAVSYTAPIRVGGSYMLVATSREIKQRVGGSYMLVAGSLASSFVLNRLESNSEIYGPLQWSIDLTPPQITDPNPYRPSIPESMVDLGEDTYNYMRENQETLREQHNLIQAGDSTFPAEMIFDTHEEQLYTCGAIGRFYHEDYGIVHARYVQFVFMVETPFVASPVGLVKSQGKTNWAVTNRFDYSDPRLAVGIIASLKQPKELEFGWVIIDGANLQPLYNTSTTAETGEEFGWSASGAVNNSAGGRVLARRVGPAGSTAILAGEARIELEGLTLGAVTSGLQEFIEGLEATVNQLVEDIQLLKDSTTIDDKIKAINKLITTLTARLTAEETARRTAVNAINNRINNLSFVTGSQLGNAVTALQNSLAALQSALGARIEVAKSTAEEALALAQSLGGGGTDLSEIQRNISLILDMITAIREAPKGKFPVVDGSVPPNLMYLDDGSLLYEETY